MSLIRNGYAVSTRRGFLGVVFSGLLVVALFDPGAATAQEMKQIKLTDKHIQGFMAAFQDMAKLYDAADPDKPDPKVEAQAGVGEGGDDRPIPHLGEPRPSLNHPHARL